MKQTTNVIDFKSHQNKAAHSAGHGATGVEHRSPAQSVPSSKTSAPVVDMTERRNEMLTQERRTVKRSILTEFIGAHIVVPDRGLQKVAVYDISEDGISFDIELEAGAYRLGDEVGVRVYLNQYTYFSFNVKVANIRVISEDGVTRHGGSFVKGSVNDVALHHFVKFIETVSASLKTDSGDVMVSGLSR